jgi:hypothetical protein
MDRLRARHDRGKGHGIHWAKLEDISAILDLQAANFIGNLDDTERQDCFFRR